MIKSIVTLAAVILLTAASTFAELGPRSHEDQNNTLSGFVGEWYVVGLSTNLTIAWENASSVMGLTCGCPRFNMSLYPPDCVLKVDSTCDLQNDTTSAIVGNATTSGVMTLERQEDDNEYLLLYTIHNTTISVDTIPSNQTIFHEYSVEVWSKLLFLCDDGSHDHPAGILSWSANEPMDYKALLSSNSSTNETRYNQLVDAAGPEEAQGLVRLNTTCPTTMSV